MTESCDPVCDTRRPEVHRSLDELVAEIGRFVDCLGKLEERLHPVLGEKPKENDRACADLPEHPQLWKRIDAQTERLSAMQAKVNNLLSALEV